MYLVKLDSPLVDAETVRLASDLSAIPFPSTESIVDDDSVEIWAFCKIDSAAKEKILSWLCRSSSTPAGWEPTMVKDLAASKDLSSISPYPTLGIDSTIPHNRLNSHGNHELKLVPAQDVYPVWYFFYGTLADPNILARVLGEEAEEPVFYPASVRGGRLTTWGFSGC